MITFKTQSERTEALLTLYRDYLRQEDDPERAFNWALKRLNYFEDQLEGHQAEKEAN